MFIKFYLQILQISFDNVIGVVGAAKGNFGFMIFGLVLSVVLTGALATYLATIFKNIYGLLILVRLYFISCNSVSNWWSCRFRYLVN